MLKASDEKLNKKLTNCKFVTKIFYLVHSRDITFRASITYHIIIFFSSLKFSFQGKSKGYFGNQSLKYIFHLCFNNCKLTISIFKNII